MQQAEASPNLGDLMQQLALVCSFASFQPSAAATLPSSMSGAASIMAEMPAVNKQGLRDLARLIDSHLTKRAVAPRKQGNATAEKPYIVQYNPAEAEAAYAAAQAAKRQTASSNITKMPAAARRAPTSKQVQVGTPAAPTPDGSASGKLQAVADALRTGHSTVSNGVSRAAAKRSQLREKLKANSTAAENGAQAAVQAVGGSPASDKGNAIVGSTDTVESEADKSAPFQADGEADRAMSPDAASSSDAFEPKPAKKMGKNQRRKAAAEASKAQQPTASAGTEAPAPSPASTAVGIGHVSPAGKSESAGEGPALSQGATEATTESEGAKPAKSGKEALPSKAAAATPNTQVPSSTTVAVAGQIDQQPAADAAPATKADSASALASSSNAVGQVKPEIALPSSKAPVGKAEASNAQPDSKAAASQAEGDSFQASSKAVANKADPAIAPASSAAGTAKRGPEHAQTGSKATSGISTTAPSQQTVGSPTKVLSQAGNTNGKGSQAVLVQKPELPAASVAALPAAIAAHRPGAPKAVLRASAAPYTPLSKTSAAEKAKNVALGGIKAASTFDSKGKAAVTSHNLQPSWCLRLNCCVSCLYHSHANIDLRQCTSVYGHTMHSASILFLPCCLYLLH